MRAAWYDRPGAAAEVLKVGEMPIPEPGPGEVRVRVVASGLNPTDVKARVRTRRRRAARLPATSWSRWERSNLHLVRAV